MWISQQEKDFRRAGVPRHEGDEVHFYSGTTNLGAVVAGLGAAVTVNACKRLRKEATGIAYRSHHT